MNHLDIQSDLPDHRSIERCDDLLPRRLEAIASLVDHLEQRLAATRLPESPPLEDHALRHLAKAVDTTGSALRLMREQRWADACILTRAVFEQLFTYLWVVQDPDKAGARRTMVTIKQEWANAKYLEGLAAKAPSAHQGRLLEEARRYREAAEALLSRLASELGTTEKRVRDEASKRASLKAIEVNLGPEFSVPYAYYSGFVHSDGFALACYGTSTPEGAAYGLQGLPPAGLPLASDLHRVLLRLTSEVRARCLRLPWEGLDDVLEAHHTWLTAADRKDRRDQHDH